VNPYQSSAGPGPAGQGSAWSTGVSEGEQVSVSWPSSSTRARPVGDLFQPVSSSEPRPAATTVQPVAPVDGPEQGGELVPAPAPQSRYALGARWWVGRGDGLVFGMPGIVIALAASVVLVLVLAGVTVFTTSSSTESAVAGLTLDKLPAPVLPVISDGHPATIPPINAPAGSAAQTPAKASSPAPSPVAAHQQFLPAAHRAVPAPPAQTPPASDHGPVVPPPSSTVTPDDTRSRIFPPDSDRRNTESRTTKTEPCNCDDTTHEGPTHRDRPPKADHHREHRAQQAGCTQPTRPENPRSASKERRNRTAQPDDASEHQPSQGQPRCPDPGSTPSPPPTNDSAPDD
jgi:hypothetical protein